MMLVETYEMTEVDSDGQEEVESEAIELIEKMGLDGQRKLISASEDGEQVRCPYRRMTAEEEFVYKTVCPQEVLLNDYESGPIPVRVLQVASHAIDLFDFIQVWSVTDANLKNPVLVGRRGSQCSGDLFILARWGEELLPFGELKKIAAEKFRANYAAECKKILVTAKAALAEIAGLPDDACVDKSVPTAYNF